MDFTPPRHSGEGRNPVEENNPLHSKGKTNCMLNKALDSGLRRNDGH
jgi:hypothetical protein